MISIILPTYNESESGFLQPVLHSFSSWDDCEVIIVDGGSVDGTLEQLQQTPWQLVQLPRSSRAARLQKGLELSRGDIVLLHHPRSLLDASAIPQLQELAESDSAFWGGFSQAFDLQHPLLDFTSWYSNHIRLDRRQIVYLDHCLFMHRRLLDQGLTVPNLEIFEDTALSLALRRMTRATRLPAKSTTSAIRFQRNGFIRQSAMNQLLKLGYSLGISPARMNRWYEKGLDLNQH